MPSDLKQALRKAKKLFNESSFMNGYLKGGIVEGMKTI